MAIQLYRAAINAGASPVNAAYLVGAAYQESSFDPQQRGSDGGTSSGLMQINTGSYNRYSPDVQADAVAQMQAYIAALQKNAPDTWNAMQNAGTVQDVYAAQRQSPDFKMGIPGGRFDYADQVSQLLDGLNQQSGPQPDLSSWFSQQGSAHGQADIGFDPEQLLNASSQFGDNLSLGPESFPQINVPDSFGHENVPFADLSSSIPQGGFPSYNPEPGNDQFSSVDSYGVPLYNPSPSQEQFNPVDSYGNVNPEPWNESPSPVDTYNTNPEPWNETQMAPDTWDPMNPEPWDETPNPVDQYSSGTVSAEGSADVGNDFEPGGVSAQGSATVGNEAVGDFAQANDQFGEGMWYYDAQGNIVPVSQTTGAPINDSGADASGSSVPSSGPMSAYDPSFPYGAGVSHGMTGPGTFQKGTFIAGGSPGSLYGTNYGSMGYHLAGIPGTFVTTPSGQTFSTALGMWGLGAMNAAGGGVSMTGAGYGDQFSRGTSGADQGFGDKGAVQDFLDMKVMKHGTPAPSVQPPQTNADPTHMQGGGTVPGYDLGYDSELAMLEPGEVVLNKREQQAVAVDPRKKNLLPHDIAIQLYKAKKAA